MWILQITTGGKTVTRTYVEFGQLAYDDEVFAIVQDLADHDYMKWTDDELPMPTPKLADALYKTGVMKRTLDNGTVYKLSLTVAAEFHAQVVVALCGLVMLFVVAAAIGGSLSR
jgi:hypothetical protein